jgi:hypothetical protein
MISTLVIVCISQRLFEYVLGLPVRRQNTDSFPLAIDCLANGD